MENDDSFSIDQCLAAWKKWDTWQRKPETISQVQEILQDDFGLEPGEHADGRCPVCEHCKSLTCFCV